jgi:hypothetical protein
MRSLARVVAVTATAALLAACSSKDKPVERATVESPAASVVPVVTEAPAASPTEVATECSGADPTDALKRVSGPLSGDVDGNGAPDQTYLTLDAAGSPGCQAFIVVTGAATFAAPIEDWDPAAGLTSPSLNRLAQIDGRPGAEIVVNLAAGASTQFVGVWSVAGGLFDRIVAQDRGGDAATAGGTLFAFGGSVGHLEAVDCTATGEIVISSAIPKADRYQVERRYYHPVDAALELDIAKTQHPVVTAEKVNDFPEFGASPFGTCPGV